MKEYLKPEVEYVNFATESVTTIIGGGTTIISNPEGGNNPLD